MAVLSVAEAKKYLRYDATDTTQDDALAYIVEGAQRWIENYTGHILVQRTVTETLKAFPTARVTGESPYHDLHYKPYDADSLVVGYLDADLEIDETFTSFTVFPYKGTQRVIPDSAWPGTYQGVTFTYTAGYEDIDAVPEDLLHAICIYAAGSDRDWETP